ncbi:hypothetical protein CLV62_10923 [Dysgonomonas alginatilytica]|uniref:Uncharacterized protein n=1 Tax=Dysgonomonas alginatilytica TaxID=1605892 RepID=A0A2V3PWI1_9BACT|nr:hypothetical protein CLV62_10923 [Dysgonomonas alginatilytica]
MKISNIYNFVIVYYNLKVSDLFIAKVVDLFVALVSIIAIVGYKSEVYH